ncbi:MAG: hypothetical protein JXR80_00670 [Deltaproteobacteria bacterium]|nr:hypothetical protein [Deltaproteobacteria bacterium]
MNKTCKRIIGTGLAGMILGILLSIPAGATDYQALSLEELNAMRGNMATASREDRDAFKSARQEKMHSLSPDDRLAYQTDSRQNRADSSGSALRTRDGSGSGSMNHAGGTGSGMGSGSGRRGKR